MCERLESHWYSSGSWGLVAGCLLLTLLAGCTGSSSKGDSSEPLAATGLAPTPAATSPPSSASNPNAPAPTISLSASAVTVNEGANANLTWSAADADSCSASGGWTGNRAASGSATTGPLNSGTTFTLTCTGPGGSAIQMISVGVIGPVQLSWVPPEENVDGSQLLDLAGYRIYYGEASRSYSDMVELTGSAASSHTLSLATGDYYVAMTALDADGNESAYSNEVIKTRF